MFYIASIRFQTHGDNGKGPSGSFMGQGFTLVSIKRPTDHSEQFKTSITLSSSVFLSPFITIHHHSSPFIIIQLVFLPGFCLSSWLKASFVTCWNCILLKSISHSPKSTKGAFFFKCALYLKEFLGHIKFASKLYQNKSTKPLTGLPAIISTLLASHGWPTSFQESTLLQEGFVLFLVKVSILTKQKSERPSFRTIIHCCPNNCKHTVAISVIGLPLTAQLYQKGSACGTIGAYTQASTLKKASFSSLSSRILRTHCATVCLQNVTNMCTALSAPVFASSCDALCNRSKPLWQIQ